MFPSFLTAEMLEVTEEPDGSEKKLEGGEKRGLG